MAHQPEKDAETVQAGDLLVTQATGSLLVHRRNILQYNMLSPHTVYIFYMPIHHMLYRCPRCGHDPLDGHKGRSECSSCGTRFQQGRGSVIIVRPPKGPPERTSASSLLADVEKMGGPGTGREPGGERGEHEVGGMSEEGLFREARIVFGKAEGHDVIRLRGEVLGFSERISWKGEGLIKLEGEALTFAPDPTSGRKVEEFSCILSDIRGVLISSSALQVTLDGGRMYQFEFVDDSSKRWEDLVCLALTRLYARGGQLITEFKPRITVRPDNSLNVPGVGRPR